MAAEDIVNELLGMLKKWPLLLVGLALFLWGVALASDEDPSDARALLLGVASVLIGAGIVVVVGTETADRVRKNRQLEIDEEDTGA
jgi:hypothetical protein